MKSYVEYQEEVSGIKDVSETVKVIEKIAATKVIFLKNKSFNLNIYTQNLRDILFRLNQFYIDKDNFLLKNKKNGKKILLIITSNKSLVGGLWHKITDKVLEKISEYDLFYTLGSKGKKLLEEEGVKIEKDFYFREGIPEDEEVVKVFDNLFVDFQKNNIKQIDIIYADFKTISEQKVIIKKFLPFDFNAFENEKKVVGLPIFEQSKKEIFNSFLKKYINSFFYSMILESSLSEFSAKTVEMEHAEKKSKDIIKEKVKEFTRGKRKLVTQRQLEAFTYKK